MPNVQRKTSSPSSSDSGSSNESRDSQSPPPPPPPPSLLLLQPTGSSRTVARTGNRNSSKNDSSKNGSGKNGGSKNGSGKDSNSSSSSNGDNPKPLSRRGHFKSRLGCFNCKRRRVKCNELRPSCSPCCRLGLTCSYPTPPSSASSPSSSGSASSSSSCPPRASLSTLALEDLRFYHQFLTAAFPTLPLKADEVWTQVAAMSHSYEHLAHAVLGLGASHLSQHGNLDFTAQALQHRVAAMKLVNEQLDKPPTKPADADALLATLICLVAQSSLMPDSMVEYLTMARGGNLVSQTIIPDLQASIFKRLNMEEHCEDLTKVISEQPRDFAIIEGFRSSVMQLESLCKSPNESVYWACLVKSITSLRTSCFDAWIEFANVFMLPTAFSNEHYLSFVDPKNYAGRLLIIHMFLLDYVLGHYCIAPSDGPRFPGRKNMIISWTKNLTKSLPPEYQKYAEWPQQYCDVLAQQDARYLLSP